MTVLLASLIGGVISTILIGSLGAYYILCRCERAVVWSDDATIYGRVRVHAKYAYTHDHHKEFAHILLRGLLIGLVFGGVVYIFGVGLYHIAYA